MPDAKRRFDLWRDLAHSVRAKGLYIIGINMMEFKMLMRLGLDAMIVSSLGVINTDNVLVNQGKASILGH